MSAEDDAAGAKREREEDPADADDAPAAKEARVDAEAPADASADPAANAEDAPAGDAPAGDAPAQEEANAPAAPAPSATLTEALDLLAPKVTKRLENLHASGSVAEGEIDAATLAELGEFSPAQAVEILDRLTEDALKGVEDKSAFLREVMQSFRAPPPPRRRAAAPAAAPAAPGGGHVAPHGGAPSGGLADALQRLYAQGVVQPHQLDSKMHEHLASMPEHAAVAAIDELAGADVSGIRNMNGYLKSICRRHEGPGGFGGGFSAGGGRQAPPEAFFEIQRRFQMGVITQPVAMRLEQFYQDTGASLDGQAWEMMLQLNEMSAMAAIEEVHAACRGGQVRNPSAFFTGIARKHRAAMEQGQPFAPPAGYGGGPPGYGGGPPGGFRGGGGYGAPRRIRRARRVRRRARPAAVAAAARWTTARCSSSSPPRCTSASPRPQRTASSRRRRSTSARWRRC